MIKRILVVLALLASPQAFAAYSPGTFITDPTGVNGMAVKPASTAPLATDPAGVVSISPNGNTVQVSTSALPTGGSTAANQATEITSLSSIDGKLTTTGSGLKVDVQTSVLPTGGSTSALQTSGNATLTAISGQLPATLGQKLMANSLSCAIASDQSALPVTGTFWQATQPVSGTFWQATQPVSAASLPLPTGAATSALQTTGNTSLSTIATNSGKVPPNLTAAFSQTSVTTTASTISAPANAVRVMIQGDATNTDCIRYRFDGTAATATVGIVAQAGQDSGQLDSGMSVSVASCSGTQKVNVQYFAQ